MERRWARGSLLGISMLASVLFQWPVLAEEGIYDIGDEPAKSSAIVEFFQQAPASTTVTKSIMRPHDLGGASRKLSMRVKFQFNSSRLTEAGKRALEPIGEALSSKELGKLHFSIEGHTDAKGKASYNLELSNRRAETVMDHLIDAYDIDPSRLRAVGKGSTELLDKSNPYSPENRRVVISLTGG